MTAADAARPRVLVVDDEEGIRTTLDVLFRRAGFDVSTSADGAAAIETIRSAQPFDLVVTDLVMPEVDGIEVLRAAKERARETQVLVATAYSTVESAIAAMRLGAYDYIQKPFATEEIRALAEKAVEKRRLLLENIRLRERVAGRYSFGDIIGRSERIREVVDLCRRAAAIPTNLLVTGESGTGKELAARAIHFEGLRADKPFVVVDCGAIPEALIESELFGHLRGAFTGAVSAQPGLLRSAEGGTVFLDEVAELPTAMQAKLLRAIQERVVRPVGGAEEIAVDVRVVAATNRDPEAEVAAGRFREDLYYRLNVLRIAMPPLRERAADIEPLAAHFLARYNEALGRSIAGFAPAATRALLAHDYPGNVRELSNVVERAVALTDGDTIAPEAIRLGRAPGHGAAAEGIRRPPGMSLDAFLEDIDRRSILEAIAQVGPRHRDLAAYLGVSERALRYRLDKHAVRPEEEAARLLLAPGRGDGHAR